MFTHFKTSWRFIRKNKATSIINIGGLAVGMAVAILIGLWVYDEVTYNQSNRNHDRVGNVVCPQTHLGVTFSRFLALRWRPPS